MPARKSGSEASSACKSESAASSARASHQLCSASKPAKASSDSVSESAASSAQASHQLCSAAKPANDHCVVAFYNITWDNGCLTGKNRKKHEKSLAADLDVALKSYKADVVLLSECGEIEEGLIEKQWLPLVRKLAGPGFAVKHQSHYTSIVRLNTVQIREGPMLMGPMTTWQGLHEYRKCQFLSIAFKDSADKPINIFNCHSPSSTNRPLNPTVRKQILRWFLEHVGDRALIGGDLNSSRMALDDQLKKDPGIFYLYEEDHWHGDIIIAKGVQATSVACNVSSTSKSHHMCMATVQLQSDSADKPAATSWKKEIPEKKPETTGGRRAGGASVPWWHRPAQAMASQHPLADALFSELGAHLDAGEAERKLYNDLAEKLWTGQFFHDVGSADKPAKPARHPYQAKARLERVLRKSIDVRERYQRRLFDDQRQIPDLDFKRSLDYDETTAIHNAWMNDVSDWMSNDCLRQYDFLLERAKELDKQAKKGKGKEKPPKGRKKGSVAKPADKGKGKGSKAKPAEVWKSPRQQAQQLKKQRFNKATNDLAGNKAFFFSFVRYPASRTAQGIRTTLHSLAHIKESREYKQLVEASTKKNDEQQSLKRRRDMAHVVLKRAKRDGGPDDVDALERAYKKARVAYAKIRNSSALLDRTGVAASALLHGDVEIQTEIEAESETASERESETEMDTEKSRRRARRRSSRPSRSRSSRSLSCRPSRSRSSRSLS